MVASLLDPGGLACVHIAEIPEALGMEIFKTVIILCIGPPVCHIIAALLIDVDIGQWIRFPLCFPLVRICIEVFAVDSLSLHGGNAHPQMAPAVACKLPAIVFKTLSLCSLLSILFIVRTGHS